MTENLKQKIEEAKAFIDQYLSDDNIKKAMMFSGGKDSIVVSHLLQINNVKNLKHFYIESGMETTTFNKFMQEHYKNVKYLSIGKSVFDEWIDRKYLPYPAKTRDKYFQNQEGKKYAYCCAQLRWPLRNKCLSDISILIYGIKSRDTRRSGRFDNDVLNEREITKYCPIYNWTDEEVWEYINYYNIETPLDYKLYGVTRNCPACPLMLSINSSKKILESNPELLIKLKVIANFCFENNPYLQEQFKTAEKYWECISNVTKFRQYVYQECEYFIDPESGIKYSNNIKEILS